MAQRGNKFKRDWLRGRRWCGGSATKYDDFPVPAALYRQIFFDHPNYTDAQIRAVAKAIGKIVLERSRTKG